MTPNDFISNHTNSLALIGDLIEETFLQKGAEFLYNKYLKPKIRPFTVHDTLMLASQQIAVSTIEFYFST